MLNRLHNMAGYKSFCMNNYVPKINHLSFANDTIRFCNSSKISMKMVLDTLTSYEKVSGQLIHKNKSCFALLANTKTSYIVKIQNYTCMHHQQFPIKYLGCPLITRRKKISYFADSIDKIINKIRGWHTKLLSHGERDILLRHVLLSC